jgi:hypothetical protein
MLDSLWLQKKSPAFRLMIATSWLAPDSWQNHQSEAIREAIAAEPDWTEYLRLVDRHCTPALSWASLKRVPGLKIPPSAEEVLRQRSDACRMQAMRHCARLVSVLKAFNQAGIPAMPMKGPILSFELYGDIGLRHSFDLDLAVVPGDLSSVQSCLRNLGWQLDSSYGSMTSGQWENIWKTEQHLGFVSPEGDCALEIHWRNLWDRWELPSSNTVRWERSLAAVWQGCAYQAMNPIDHLLYLCNHGGRHAWERAKWLGDLARIHAQGQTDWQMALDQAGNTEQEIPLLLCLRLLQTVHGLPVPSLLKDPVKKLSPLLMDTSLFFLAAPTETVALDALGELRSAFRLARYERQIWPQRPWRQALARFLFSHRDFKLLALPDCLFWAYLPMRPILWAWRRFARLFRHGENGV